MVIKLTRTKVPEYVFDIIQVGLLFSIIGASSGNSQLNSIGVWVILFAIIIQLVFGRNTKRNSHAFKVLILLTLLSFLSMLVSGLIEYHSIVVLVSFLEIPILIVLTEPMEKEHRIKVAAFFSILLTIYFMFMYFSPRAHIFKTQYGNRVIDDLTLGFSNSNETGMHLLTNFFVLLTSMVYVKKKSYKILFLVASVLLMFLIVQTKSRACILIGALMLVILLPVIKRERISKRIQFWCLFSPIVVLLISVLFLSFFSSAVFMGDVFDTGRSAIYLGRLLKMSPLQWVIGDYTYLYQNSLNAYVSVFVTSGIISLVLFILILNYGVGVCDREAKSPYNRVAFMALLLLFVHASLESAMLVSGSFYAASFFSIYALAIDGNNNQL